MKKLFEYFRNTFELSYRETVVSFQFIGVLLVVSLIWYFSQSFFNDQSSKIEIESYQTEADRQIKNYEKPKFEAKSSSSKFTFQPFDPNTISTKELEEMGLSSYFAKNLVTFREKGMIYKKKEDILKIYGMNEDVYRQLEPFIEIKTSISKVDSSRFKYKSEPRKAYEYSYKRPKSFDINSASIEELTTIHGIGEVFAKRIINYREALGGFHHISQVKGVYGLTPEAYDSLAVVAKINSAIKKIKINQIEIGNFKHPYLKQYQINGIVNYRKQHGKFASIKDLEKLKVLNPKTIADLEPYLSFEN